MTDQTSDHVGKLTDFQITCESNVLATLRESGLSAASEIRWIGEPVIVVTADALEIWIYIDEAGISRPVDWRYEKWDFDSPGDLIGRLSHELGFLLKALSTATTNPSRIRRPRPPKRKS